MYASNGILFNHESPRRGETFVTRKITRGLTSIHKGSRECLYLGNLNALRDWGHARDYAEAMWMILQQDKPDDFVISTGKQYSVRDFVELCAHELGWGSIIWSGEGCNEIGRRSDTNAVVIRIDPIYYRPSEVNSLLGNPTKANQILGWSPKTDITQLVSEMISSDLENDSHA